MTTLVAHNATPLPDAMPHSALTTLKGWLKQYLKACNSELVESLFEWAAGYGLSLLLAIAGLLADATNWH